MFMFLIATESRAKIWRQYMRLSPKKDKAAVCSKAVVL